MRNPRYLSEDQTVLSVELAEGRIWILEKGVTPEFEEVRSQFSQITPYEADPDDGPEKPEMVISALQAKVALLEVGLLDEVEEFMSTLDRMSQLAWQNASTFSRESPLLNGLAAGVTWPDGRSITPEEIDQLFERASQISV